MTVRIASCRCGQLKASATGDPVRVSACHCLACQKRSGSAFATQARWPAEAVKVEGRSKQWVRTADSGRAVIYSFCPDCGSTVHYTGGNFPDLIAIPLGAFDDPYFVAPRSSVWECRKHEWADIVGPVEHIAAGSRP